MSEAAVSPGYRQYARDVSQQFLGLTVVLPLGAAVVAIGLQDVAALNLVHVVTGAVWAGATVYLAGVLSPTLLELEPPQRASVTVPLIPKHILLYSSLALATLLTGAALAGVSGRDNTAPAMLAAWLVGLALLVVAVYLVRVQGNIYGEVHGGEPDMARVGSLASKLGKAGMLGLVLQVLTLAVMAWVRVA